MVYTDTGIQRQPFAEVLTEVDISGKFIHLLVYTRNTFAGGRHSVPRFAAEVLIVETHSQTVAGEKRCALVPRYTQHPVFGIEVGFLRCSAGMIAVVDFMTSPVVKETQGAGAFLIMVFESERSHAARDA